MLYFFCPDSQTPYGGIKMIYHCVDILNDAGLDARVSHSQPGFRCDWFPNDTRMAAAGEIVWNSDDIAVWPEIIGPGPIGSPSGIPKVIFNQGAYLTFRGYSQDLADRRTPYRDPDLLAVVTVSEDSRRYLAYTFPELALFRVRPAIDPAIFHLSEEKKDQVAFMPRKFSEDIRQVLNILKFRDALAGFDLVPVENCPQGKVAEVLQHSKVFLHFAAQEGFGLPAAEAMACGCSVVGYHGQGGREFLRRPHAWPIETGNVIGFCEAVETVLAEWRRNPAAMQLQGAAAARFVTRRYSPANGRQDIVKAWREILRLRRIKS